MAEKKEIKSVSMPEGMYRRILDVVADRARRGESGGFSGAVRELIRPELDRRVKRGKSSPEAAA